MKEQPKYVLLDKRQTVAESLLSDGVTFALLLLCIFASQGSRWWTFFTALMFIAWLGGKGAAVLSTRQTKFKDLDDMQAWINKERSNTQVQP